MSPHELEEAGRQIDDGLGRPFAASSVSDRRAMVMVGAEVRMLLGDPRGGLERGRPVIDWMRSMRDAGERHFPDFAIVGASLLVAAGEAREARELVAVAPGVRTSPLDDAARALAAWQADPAVASATVAASADALEAQGRRVWAGRLEALAAVVMGAEPTGREAAVALARQSRWRFAALGADAWVRRLEAMLRSWGERAPTRAGPGEGGLSARELEVLALVAEGLTNRQIAERLVVSPHTAVRHVANLMAKLGAPSRAAAVKVAAERGLLGGDMAMREGPE